MTKLMINIVVFTILIWFMMPAISHAYLDPGSGSLIFQMIIAGAAGIAFAAKLFKHRVKQIFSALIRGSSHEKQ